MKKHLKNYLFNGMLVNFNTAEPTVDMPGGMHDAGPGSSSISHTVVDGSDEASNVAVAKDNASADDKGSGGEDKNKGAGGDGANSSQASPNNDKLDKLSSSIEGLIDLLKGQSTSSKSKDGGGDDVKKASDAIKTIMSMESDDLKALISDDPHKFVSALTTSLATTIKGEVSNDLSVQRYNESVERGIMDYAEKNSDFESMWTNGKIQDYISKHPEHNALSAHMAMTMENRLAQAKKEGKEEGLKEAENNFKAKRDSQTLGGGGNAPPADSKASLNNTRANGGRARVVAQRAGLIP